MNRSPFKRWSEDERGSSATEFAMVLPLLVLLMFTLFEIGRFLLSYNIVSSTVRDASRYAGRLSMSCSGFTDTSNVAVVQRLTRTGTTDVGGTPLLPNWTSDGTVQITFGCVSNSSGSYLGVYQGVAQIPTVTVAAAAPYTLGMGGLLRGFGFTTVKARHSQPWTQQ